jgi:hypothetical protein
MNDISMQPHLPESRCHGHRLMGHDPDFSRKLTGLHWEPDRGVHGPDPSVFEPAHDFPGDIVDVVTRAMEFQIGNGSGGTPDRLPVHPADQADERLCRGKGLENRRSFRGNFRSIDADEADIISSSLQAHPAQVVGGQGGGRGRPRLASESHDGRMLVERSHHEPPGCFPRACK